MSVTGTLGEGLGESQLSHSFTSSHSCSRNQIVNLPSTWLLILVSSQELSTTSQGLLNTCRPITYHPHSTHTHTHKHASYSYTSCMQSKPISPMPMSTHYSSIRDLHTPRSFSLPQDPEIPLSIHVMLTYDIAEPRLKQGLRKPCRRVVAGIGCV